jgi:hypothetical protein
VLRSFPLLVDRSLIVGVVAVLPALAGATTTAAMAPAPADIVRARASSLLAGLMRSLLLDVERLRLSR